MKSLIVVISLMIICSFGLYSQEDKIPNVIIKENRFDKKKYQETYSSLDLGLINTNFLADRSIQMLPFHNYNGTDTAKVVSYSIWRMLYNQIRGSSVSKECPFPKMDSLFADYSGKNLKGRPTQYSDVSNELVNTKKLIEWEDFIPLSVIDVEYNEIRQDAFEKGLLKIENSKIIESKAKNKENPYTLKNLYAATVLKHKIYQGAKVTLLFDESFYFTNKDVSNCTYEIDLDDGNGFRKIQFGQSIHTQYAEKGEKILQLRKTGKNSLRSQTEQEVSIATFSVSVSALDIPLPTFTIPQSELTYYIPLSFPHGGASVSGTAYVLTADGSNYIRNPIIISDGFDPTNERDYYGIYAMIDTTHFVDCIRSNGYDLIILDFADGGTYIERNAFLLMNVIQNINARKITENKLIVVGTSMAGLISRYALAYMEQNNIDHDTRLYVSFDSPEKGANIPLGLQYWFYFFSDMNDDVGYMYNNALCSSAAKQMLVYHSTSSPNTNSLRTNFLNNMNALGYPSKLRKIAIANGAGNAYGQRKDNGTLFNPTDQIINWQYRSFIVDIDGNSWAVPNYSPLTTIFDGNIDVLWVVELFSSDEGSLNVQVSGTSPYDNAPGGTNNTMEQMALAGTGGYGQIGTEISNHCFIPTVSSLAINTSNLFYNISTDPNIMEKTPFDTIYYPLNTNEPHAFISQNCISWLNDELVPQDLELDGLNDSWNKGEVRASNSITLKPGFHTVPGQTFNAYISPLQPCNFSLSPSSVAENNHTTINSNYSTRQALFINNVSVFPNPNGGIFYIKNNAVDKISRITIQSMQGVMVQNIADISRDELLIDISHCTPGIFFVKIIFENTVKTHKIIKQ